jgi:CcmD family protein
MTAKWAMAKGKWQMGNLLWAKPLWLVALLVLSGSMLFAQQPPPTAPEGFVALDPSAQREQLPAAPLVMAAYGIAWVLILGYLWSIWRRLTKVEREIADLGRRIERGARR